MHLSFCLVTFLFLCPSTVKSIVDSFNKCESESGGQAGWCEPVLPLLGRNVGAAFSESREQHSPALQTLQPPHPPTHPNLSVFTQCSPRPPPPTTCLPLSCHPVLPCPLSLPASPTTAPHPLREKTGRKQYDLTTLP